MGTEEGLAMSTVKSYRRTTASGKTATVRQHTRAGDAAEHPEKVKRKRGPNPGHAGKLGKKAFRHARGGRKAKAGAFALLALGEMVSWFTLGGTALVLALLGGLCVAVSIALVK